MHEEQLTTSPGRMEEREKKNPRNITSKNRELYIYSQTWRRCWEFRNNRFIAEEEGRRKGDEGGRKRRERVLEKRKKREES